MSALRAAEISHDSYNNRRPTVSHIGIDIMQESR
jgi:hypothetical protein